MKINDRIVGGITAIVLMAAVTTGAVAFVAGANATPEPAAVETVDSIDLDAYPDTNGLAAEQEAAAAQAEADRIAAEAAAAEAARVAAEAAAQAEADRVAAEQAAANAEAESFDAPADEPAPEPAPEEFTGPLPGTQVHTICQVLEDGTQVPCQ